MSESRLQREKYEIRTTLLASDICRLLPREQWERLYSSMRASVYGLPANAIPLKDLVHCVADLQGKVDPSGDSD